MKVTPCCLPPCSGFPSTALAADCPVSHVDPEGDILEHRAIEEKEMSFPTLPENAELGHQALVSDTDDIPSTCLGPNPGEMESQVAPGPSGKDASSIPGSDVGPWMSPLAWLEKGVNTSVMLENLRQSLSSSAFQNAAPALPLSLLVRVGTWFTPPAQQERSTNTSQTGQGTKDSASETEHLLWGKCPVSLCSRASFAWIHHSLPPLPLLPTFFSFLPQPFSRSDCLVSA